VAAAVVTDIVLENIGDEAGASSDDSPTAAAVFDELSDESMESEPEVGAAVTAVSEIPESHLGHVVPEYPTDAPIGFANDKFRFDNSELNHKDNINWLVSDGACQPEEKDMPNHRFPPSSDAATKSRRASTRRFSSAYYFTSE